MTIIEIIITALVFVLGYCIWRKVVDRVDEFLKKRISDRSYNILTWGIFVFMFGLVIYSIIR